MSGTEKRATTAPKPGKPGSHTKAPRDVSEGAAVSMPKTAPRAAQGINFGTVDDQNAVMSSSPAAQPTTGEHLPGGNLTVFGSVSAESGAAHEKKIGFGPKKHMDFQKLFQGPKKVHQQDQQSQQQPAAPVASAMGATPPPFVSSWQPPMYPHVGYPMSPGGYPYMAQPQQPWNQAAAPGSPSILPANASPHTAPRPVNGGFYPQTPAAAPPTSSNFTMSAGARMFEPQKSKALRIVNPETQTEIDLGHLKKTSQSSASPTQPTSAKAPADASHAPTPKQKEVSNESRVKTQNDFQQKVLRLKMEKEAEARRAEEAKREEERKAEEAKREEERQAEEAKREEERKAEEAKREEERKAEEAKREEERKAEEAKREEERKAEEAKREEERKAEAAKREGERKAEEAQHAEERKKEEPQGAEAKDGAESKDNAAQDGQAPEASSSKTEEAQPPSRAIESARLIDDLSSITYPPDVHPPKAELNKDAAPGRYRYDRDFLLQFMSVYTEKPFELPDLASIGMESVPVRGGRRGAGPSRGGMDGGRGQVGRTSEERFASSMRAGPGGFPSGSRGGSASRTGGGPVPSRETMGTGIPMGGGRSKGHRGRQRDGRPRENPPEKGGPTIPLDQVAPLEFSENRWKPQSHDKASTADHSLVVERKVKSLLNKLTLEKFDSISDKIIEFANESKNETDGRTLRQVIALVFEKAIDESAWSEMYAQLCAKIQMSLSPDIRDEVLDEKEQKEYRGGMLFRKYLLTWCQGDFEKGWAGAKEERSEKEYELMSDEYYEAQKAKRRGLGLIQFVGELFKLQMLQPRIMHTCIVRLLRTTTEPEEDEIESVCRLLTTVGYLLDSASGNHKSRMDVYFKRIDDILKSPALASRMRFMLMDVVDLRNNNWVPRHDQSAPKTIGEIHAEAAQQQQQKEAEKFSRGGPRRGQPRHAPPPEQASHDGWSTVGNAPPSRSGRATDFSGFGKGLDRSSNGKLGGGPQSVFHRRNQRDDERSMSPTPNMFNLLTGEGNTEEPHRRKLQLQPRTKPLDDGHTAATPSEPSDEDIKRKVSNDVKEYLEIRDLNEGIQSIEALEAKHRPSFVDALVTSVLDKKQDSVDAACHLLQALAERSLLDESMLMEGFKPQVTILDDTSMDAPSAYGFMAQLLVQSTLAQAKIEELANGMEGEGLKPPKDRLLAKVQDVQS